MKLASYNIRKAIGLDRRRKPGRIIDVINALDADVVVLQEADKRLGARPTALPRTMLEAHSDFTPAPVAGNDVSLGFHGNAILVRKGLNITNARTIPLPGFEPRGAVAVEIANRINIAGVHLGLMRRHRRSQLAALLAALKDSNLPTAILGDFNEWSPDSGLEALQGHYAVISPGHSYHAARPLAALDRVALSPQLVLRHAGVSETALARIASDHLPIWAELDLPAQESAHPLIALDTPGADSPHAANLPVAPPSR